MAVKRRYFEVFSSRVSGKRNSDPERGGYLLMSLSGFPIFSVEAVKMGSYTAIRQLAD